MDEKKILMFRGKPVNDMDREELLVAVHMVMDMYERERHTHKQTLDMWSVFRKASK